jgi:hypothetical protein
MVNLTCSTLLLLVGRSFETKQFKHEWPQSIPIDLRQPISNLISLAYPSQLLMVNHLEKNMYEHNQFQLAMDNPNQI